MSYKVRCFYETASGVAFGDKGGLSKAQAEKLYFRLKAGDAVRVTLFEPNGRVRFDHNPRNLTDREPNSDDCPF